MNGEVFEGGTAKDVPLDLGSNRFNSRFEDALVGIKAGEQKDNFTKLP